jgi:hypothetical protein
MTDEVNTGAGTQSSKTPESETVRLIYEHIKDAPQQQLELVKALDDKMVKIFTAAGVVIGLAGLSGNNFQGGIWINILLFSAVGAFVATASLTLYHLWPVQIALSRHAGTLWDYSRYLSTDEVRQQLIKSISRSNAQNEILLQRKTRIQTYALIATTLEVVLVGLAIAVSRMA